MREIMDVPFPLANCRLLMSFLTFQISTFLSEAVSSLILGKILRANHILNIVQVCLHVDCFSPLT